MERPDGGMDSDDESGLHGIASRLFQNNPNPPQSQDDYQPQGEDQPQRDHQNQNVVCENIEMRSIRVNVEINY